LIEVEKALTESRPRLKWSCKPAKCTLCSPFWGTASVNGRIY